MRTMPNFTLQTTVPQIHPTSRPLFHWKSVSVRLKTVDIERPVKYTRQGVVSKNQPRKWKIDDIVLARVGFDGLIKLLAPSSFGDGYEILADAREGEHFEFYSGSDCSNYDKQKPVGDFTNLLSAALGIDNQK